MLTVNPNPALTGIAAVLMTLVGASMTLVSGSGAAKAQTPTDLARCRAISDNLKRLSCFDALVPPSAGKEVSGGYQRISLTDLKVDLKQMGGQAVEVDGYLMLMGEVLMLGSEGVDTSPIFIDFKRVPRDQRRRIVECGMQCPAVVRGKVGKVMMSQMGIIAETITLR